MVNISNILLKGKSRQKWLTAASTTSVSTAVSETWRHFENNI